MNPQQPRGIDEKDMERAIDAYTGVDDNFLKKILKGSETGKKVENFLVSSFCSFIFLINASISPCLPKSCDDVMIILNTIKHSLVILRYTSIVEPPL